MKKLLLACALLPLAGCAQQANDSPPQLGIKEAKDLAKALDGKVAGDPVSCIPAWHSNELRALGDNTLVVKVNRNLVYRNTLSNACRGLAQGDTLVMTLHSSQYCRGDIARVVNLPSGMMSGTCALGDWVPYRTPGTGK